MKSQLSRRLCRPGLLVTGKLLIVAFYLPSSPGLHAQHLSSLCCLRTTGGRGVAFYSFSEYDTNHSSLQADGVGREPVAFYSNTVVFGVADASGEIVQNKGVETRSK